MIFVHNLGNHIPCPLNWCFKHTASLNFSFILYLKGKLLTGISWKTGIFCKMYFKKTKTKQKQNKTKQNKTKQTPPKPPPKNKTKQNKKTGTAPVTGVKMSQNFQGPFWPMNWKKMRAIIFWWPLLALLSYMYISYVLQGLKQDTIFKGPWF